MAAPTERLQRRHTLDCCVSWWHTTKYQRTAVERSVVIEIWSPTTISTRSVLNRCVCCEF